MNYRDIEHKYAYLFSVWQFHFDFSVSESDFLEILFKLRD